MTARTRTMGAPGMLLVVALALFGLAGSPATATGAIGTPATNAAAGTALPAWTGGVELYRAGTFTTQRTWLWCTAAGVQIARNIVDHEQDHSVTGQRRYFDWMRQHNRYDLPLSAGVDAQGWAAGMRHFVDDRYRLVSSGSFDSALRSAVERMRRTNLPVAITVMHGNHAWLLVGFRATADPGTTSRYTVTSVRVVGPLFGLQSRNGYDMPPNTRLTPAQLRRFFTPWHYDPKPMIWDGHYISIQPVPRTAAVKPAAKPVKPAPSAKVAAAAATLASLATLPPIVARRLEGAADAAFAVPGAVADARDVPPASAPPAGAADPSGPADPASDQPALVMFFLVALPVAAIAATLLGPWGRRRRHGSR